MPGPLKYGSVAPLILTVLIPVWLHAHGVNGDIHTGGVVITARHETGEPMSYAQTTVHPPESKMDFQTGRPTETAASASTRTPPVSGKSLWGTASAIA